MLTAQVCGVSSGKLLGLIAIYRTGEPVGDDRGLLRKLLMQEIQQ